MKGRLIGLDHGSKRIGLAVSDALGIVARELTIVAEDHTRQGLRADPGDRRA